MTCLHVAVSMVMDHSMRIMADSESDGNRVGGIHHILVLLVVSMACSFQSFSECNHMVDNDKHSCYLHTAAVGVALSSRTPIVQGPATHGIN